MAVKRTFGADGVLTEVEIPDAPLPGVVFDPQASGIEQFLKDTTNPSGVDLDTLLVDAATLPDLNPTRGAQPLTKFPEPLPGNGEGAGMGQKSGASLRDAWNNNPLKDAGTVETLQSGPVGSAVVGAPDTDRKVGGSSPSPQPGKNEQPDETWTKAQLAEFIESKGGTPPADTELKAVFLEAAQNAALA